MSDTLQEAFVAAKEKVQHHAVRAILQRVANVSTLSKVPPNARAAVIAALNAAAGRAEKPEPESLDGLAERAYAKFNSAGQR
jgi:hypothetical protein